MIKRSLFIIFLSFPLFGHHLPPSTENDTAKSFHLNVFKKLSSKLKLKLKSSFRLRKQKNDEKQVSLGGQYRLSHHWFSFIHVEQLYGQRSDNDWIHIDGWHWRDNKSQSQQKVGAGLIYKTILIDWKLPLLFEGKTSVDHNLTTGHRTLKLSPMLRMTFFKDSDPLLSPYLKYEAYLPHNFSDETIYQSWFYMGLIYHFQEFNPFIFYSSGSQKWTGSDSFKTRFNTTYLTEMKIKEIGIGITLNY